ncbi:MAG: rod shape-determining protein RodA [Zetaproteobacteria bacterium CG12_big_fil_rev_8_21_14_0_65_54_13]|nr:MAG: rod shape-determining protein RodA [Zetaproteobacteria bacterium CG12_big_fil_rev_8_21_14_0_65_54_13]PIX55066.1 MAG: rod shape-determining protein RodA [Zetaproteobacteria bacterium CG_4_10_14_3_um_filter_54_28]PJA30215.1 MAG: rod shape-determining protein RodA [Zetaproteobacteria bacterium CG_4_9_14_3_um_filter_54_145]
MNIKRSFARLALVAVACALISCSEEKGAHVAIVQPVDGATVDRSFKVVMSVEGKTVHKTGERAPDSGHFLLVVDGGYLPMGEVMISDREHLSFDQGETETTLHLYPGKHTLTLQFAKSTGQSYGHALSHSIAVNVK